MSGTGDDGGGYTPADERTPCDQLQFDATVASPQPSVVQQLQPGDELDVDHRVSDGTRAIVLLTADGNLAGALTTRTADLLRCLQAGFEFVAVVRSVDGGAVHVHVQPKT